MIEPQTISIEIDDLYGLNVFAGDRLIVRYMGIEYQTMCRGWNRNQDGTFDVKTTLFLPEHALSDHYPMADCRIIISPREASLRNSLKTKAETINELLDALNPLAMVGKQLGAWDEEKQGWFWERYLEDVLSENDVENASAVYDRVNGTTK